MKAADLVAHHREVAISDRGMAGFARALRRVNAMLAYPHANREWRRCLRRIKHLESEGLPHAAQGRLADAWAERRNSSLRDLRR